MARREEMVGGKKEDSINFRVEWYDESKTTLYLGLVLLYGIKDHYC